MVSESGPNRKTYIELGLIDRQMAKEGIEAELRITIEAEMKDKYSIDKAAIEAAYKLTTLDDPNFALEYMMHQQKKKSGS